MHPKEFRYSPEHIWLKDEGNGQFRIGITYHYQGQLKSVVYLDLPGVGSALRCGEPFGAIESSKINTDLISPISGTVTAVNDAVTAKPGLINKDPYGAGWLMLAHSPGTNAGTSLLSADEYLAAVSSEAEAGQ